MKKGFVSLLSMGLGGVSGALFGAAAVEKKMRASVKCECELKERHMALFMLMNRWVKVKQENKSIAEYLLKNGYKNIAIYGMSYVGEALLNELVDSEVNVKYAIDKKADEMYSDIELLSPDDKLKEVDAVIVTAITFYEEIEEMLAEKMDCPILSIENILEII